MQVTTAIKTNLITNPSFQKDISTWGVYGSTTASFNGTSTYVSVAPMNLGTGYTIVARVRMASALTSGWFTVFGGGNASDANAGSNLGIHANGTIGYGNFSAAFATTSSGTFPADNAYHTVAVTVSYAGTTATVQFFLDGATLNTATFSSATSPGNFLTPRIGAYAGIASFFKGDMDFLYFYNSILSLSQIQAPLITSATQGWDFNEGGGTSIINKTGNASDFFGGWTYPHIGRQVGAGIFGAPANRSAVSAVIQNPNTPHDLTLAQQGSYSFSFQHNGAPSTNLVLCNPGISRLDTNIEASTGFLFVWFFNASGSGTLVWKSSVSVCDNQRHTIVVNKTATRISVYLDGATEAGGLNTTALTNAKAAVSFGNTSGSIVDSLRIWNRSLSANEITNIMTSNYIDSRGLNLEWQCNEGMGTTAYDTSVIDPSYTGLNGTLSTANWVTLSNVSTKCAMRCLSNATISAGGTSGNVTTHVTGLTAGQIYTFSVSIRGVAAGATNAANIYVVSGAGTQTNFTVTTDYQRVSCTFTAGATTADIFIRTTEYFQTMYVDGAQLEAGATASSYFDGDSGSGYSWKGLPNASASYVSSFGLAATNSTSKIAYGVQVSFTKAINSTVNFFTIGSSNIGGPDMVMGANGIPAFMDIFQYGDYTDWTMGFSVTRNLGQYPYGAFGAQANITLDNTNRQFLPNFDPVIGSYITIGRPLKISAGFDNETINIFTGTGVQPKNDVQHRQFDLNAFDAMDILNNFTSRKTPIQVNVYADQIIAALLSEVGFAPSQYVAEQSLQQPIGFFSPYGLLVGDIIQALCEAEQAVFFFDENGIAHFWNRQHIANNLTSQWTFTEEDNIENVIPEETPILNDVIIKANPRAVAAKQQLWQMTSATQVPAPRTSATYTNLITNPNFEVNTNGWTGVNSVLSQSFTQNVSGIASLLVVANSGFPPSVYAQPSLSNNTTYTASLRVKGTSGQTVTLYDAVSGGQTSTPFLLTGGWDVVTWSWTVTASSTRLGIVGNTNGAALYIDAVMLQAGTTGISPTFFDGNTPYTASYVYVWNGTPNASTSTAIPCGSVVVSADFQDDDGALPVTSVDFPQYYNSNNSALTSNYTANYNNDGSGADAAGVVFIAGTSLTNTASGAAQLNGSNYQVTFLNTATTPVYITQMALYGTPAKITYVINTEYRDDASIALYGTNPANNGQPLVIQNDLIQNPSTANSNAYQLVTDFSHPYQRLTADVFPVPQLQIGDTVTVNLSDANQSLSYTIVGNTVNASTDNLISQTLELEVRVLTKYFQINVSTIGNNDQIAP